MSKLTIKDLEFDLASAKLEPFIADDEREPVKDHRFVWGVVLHSKKKTVGGATWIPSFTSERLLETEARELETWQELAGRHGSWEDAGEMGLLYAFSYLPVGNVRWRFDRAESGRLVFILDGQSHFSHPGGYEGLLLSLAT